MCILRLKHGIMHNHFSLFLISIHTVMDSRLSAVIFRPHLKTHMNESLLLELTTDETG